MRPGSDGKTLQPISFASAPRGVAADGRQGFYGHAKALEKTRAVDPCCEPRVPREINGQSHSLDKRITKFKKYLFLKIIQKKSNSNYGAYITACTRRRPTRFTLAFLAQTNVGSDSSAEGRRFTRAPGGEITTGSMKCHYRSLFSLPDQ